MPVKVAVRSRPLNGNENSSCIEIKKEESSVVLAHDKLFKFDFVFDDLTSNKDLYDECISDLINDFTNGNNTTVFAYGQTGSGKTFTMGTNYVKSVNVSEIKRGIIPRVLEDVFDKVDKKWQIEISFLEIYNEEIYDILSPKRQTVVLQEKTNCVELKNLTSNSVSCLNEALKFLEDGSVARTTGATAQNPNSSRSHGIFIVNLVRYVGNRKKNVKLHLVDLAGSEGVGKSKTEGTQKREGININLGLLSLGKVISALSNKNPGHIPYRDSVLTRLLKDSLNGKSNTLMIACVNSDESSLAETVDTLRYASWAINIPGVSVHSTSFLKETDQHQKLIQIPPTPAHYRAFGNLSTISSTPVVQENGAFPFSFDGFKGASAIKPVVDKPMFALPKLPKMKTKKQINSDHALFLSPLAQKVHRMLERSVMKKLDKMEKRVAGRKRPSLETITNTSKQSNLMKRIKVKGSNINLNHNFSSNQSPVFEQKSVSKLNLTFSPEDQSSSRKLNETFSPIENMGKQGSFLNDKENPQSETNIPSDMLDLYSPLVKKVNTLMENTIYPQIEKLLQKRNFQENENFSKKRRSPRLANCGNGIPLAERQKHLLESHENNILHILNYGSPKQLKALPFIGDKTAKVILTHREIKGLLNKVIDLKDVIPQRNFLSKFLKANCMEDLIEKI